MGKETCILLYSYPYRIVDEKSGEINEGLSLKYFPAEDLTPMVDDLNKEMKGSNTAKDNIPVAYKEKIKDVPGLYNITTKMKVDSAGKNALKITDIEFIAPLSCTPIKKS